MKVSVKKKYVEAYRQTSWSDVRESFVFVLKNPEVIALGMILAVYVFVMTFAKINSVAEDELK